MIATKKKRGSDSEPLENGGYLLSHKCSTIGDVELNDPVRNGKGWDLNAITTLICFKLRVNVTSLDQL